VLQTLRDRPKDVHVVLTGRRCPEEIIELADTVTEMKLIKHAFKAGVWHSAASRTELRFWLRTRQPGGVPVGPVTVNRLFYSP
jgi:hypothetical protein